MGKVFVEYTIVDEKRPYYLHYMQKMIKQTGLELIEGTDQKGLFVEIWADISYAEYEKLKLERLNLSMDSVWEPFGDLVKGGLTKLNIWHFSDPAGLNEHVL